jgi:hypothetical protein
MTQASYIIKLKHVQLLEPNHSLLPQLGKGYSSINCMYIERIWKGLDLSKLLENTEGVTSSGNFESSPNLNDDIDLATDEIFKAMLAKKNHQKGLLRATSNKFHACKTDEQRRQVSIQVNTLFEVFRQLQYEIDYYSIHVRLPPSLEKEESDSFFEVPGTEGEVLKMINTCHSTISQIEKDLLQFDFKIRNDETHPQHKAMIKLEKRREKWKRKFKMLCAEREHYKRAKNANLK